MIALDISLSLVPRRRCTSLEPICVKYWMDIFVCWSYLFVYTVTAKSIVHFFYAVDDLSNLQFGGCRRERSLCGVCNFVLQFTG